MEGLTKGTIVHYILTQEDRDRINRRRIPSVGHDENWPIGAQAHVGNSVSFGEEVVMIITEIWKGEFIDTSVNGQVLLDGSDSYWVTSAEYSEEKKAGTWHWIEKA